MIEKPPTFDPSIANIKHVVGSDEFYFQVLNEDATDWNEEATNALYRAWLAENG